MANNKKHIWNIETSDGNHEIRIKRGDSSRAPFDIMVDGQHIDTVQYSGGGMIPQMEYNFACGEERVTLVLHGNEFDIVHRGRLVKNNTEYKPQDKLPKAYIVIALLLTAASIAVIPLFYFKTPSPITLGLIAISIVSSMLISYSYAISPLKSKKKKIFISLFMIVWAWILAVLIAIFL